MCSHFACMRSLVPCCQCGTKYCLSCFVFKNVQSKCICKVCYAASNQATGKIQQAFGNKRRKYHRKNGHCANDGIETQCNIGTACSSHSVDRALSYYAITNETTGADAIFNAIKIEKLLLLMIDDYTTIHSHRQPTALATNNVLNMCTIIIEIIFPQLDAIQVKKKL